MDYSTVSHLKCPGYIKYRKYMLVISVVKTSTMKLSNKSYTHDNEENIVNIRLSTFTGLVKSYISLHI